MTQQEFMRSEATALRAFIDRYAMDDFIDPGNCVGYSRSYRCECGFVCRDAFAIWRHVQDHGEPGQARFEFAAEALEGR